MCKFFRISRAAYYAWVKALDQADPDGARLKQVQEAYERFHRTYGYRRIVLWLQKEKGICINHKAVLRLMNRLNIRSVAQAEIYHHYENVLDWMFRGRGPNQKWVTDVTYIATQQGWAYLSTIKDLFDGFIVAYQLGRQNSLGLVLNTVKQAKMRPRAPIHFPCLCHADPRLCHYAFHVPPRQRLGQCAHGELLRTPERRSSPTPAHPQLRASSTAHR